jgi:four helix bundle protein
MPDNNIIIEKSFQFGLRIIKLHLYLKDKKVDRVLSTQILRCGTSIGANIEEAMGGSSRKDFVQKLRIAYRETRETSYWLRLFKASDILEHNLADSLLQDCNEIKKILIAIIKSSTEKATT